MKALKILGFFASVIAVLGTLGLVVPDEGIALGSAHLRYPTTHSILAGHEQEEPDPTATAESPILTQMADSLCYFQQQTDNSDLRLWLPEPHYLDAFWAAAEQAQAKRRTLRVLHYGDSQIEMDHMTSRLRAHMQRTFGGGGPGMLPFHPITPVVSVRQSTQGALSLLSSFGDSLAVRSRGNYGVMMQCFRLNGSATTTVRATNSSHVDDGVKQFSHVRLVANSHEGTLRTELTDLKHKKAVPTTEVSQKGVSMMEWKADGPTDAFRLHVSGNADLYALLIDSDSGGVAVDNIPMRGCSGQQFTLVNKNLLTEAYGLLDVGLIILQFGGNSVPYLKSGKSISTYCQSLGKQIDYIHQCCPQAKILFIGPSDMCKHINGKPQTYPVIPELIDSLIVTVNAHDAAFWSIYHAMGGLNSMPVWAHKGLAGSDYIHFSQKGADLMGDHLAQALDNSYQRYRLEKRIELQRQKEAESKDESAKHKQKKGKGGAR